MFLPCTHCRQAGYYVARSSESHKTGHSKRGTTAVRLIRLQISCKAQSTKHEHDRLALQCAYQVKYMPCCHHPEWQRLCTAWLPYPPTCVAVQLKLNIKQQALSNTYFPTGNQSLQSGQICQVLPPPPSTCWPSVSRFTARNCISTCRFLGEWYQCAVFTTANTLQLLFNPLPADPEYTCPAVVVPQTLTTRYLVLVWCQCWTSRISCTEYVRLISQRVTAL